VEQQVMVVDSHLTVCKTTVRVRPGPRCHVGINPGHEGHGHLKVVFWACFGFDCISVGWR
jgi:hypothetical protein